MSVVRLEHLTKIFPGGTTAVDDFTLTVADGEFLVLVGPSGCGKSTVLRMIAGLEETSGGDILIDGEPVTNWAPKERDIAMVFQNYALYPHMTVKQNMGFALRLRRVQAGEIDRQVREIAQLLGLSELLDRKPAALSGGQRQRVAMGRAMVRQPRVFLMDEPLSNLDAKLRVQMRTQVARIQKTLATTTLYVTHDQTEAMTLGDRVVVLRGGVAQQVGSPTDLYQNPTNLFVAGFIGSPAMNFLAATIEGDSLNSGLGTIVMPDRIRRAVESAKGREVIMGLRPEHFEDAALAGDAPGATVTVPVDLVESMGSDVYAYFTVRGAAASRDLEDLAADAGQDMHGEGTQINARLDAAANVRAGQEATLWVDTEKMAIFDVETGANLTAESKGAHART